MYHILLTSEIFLLVIFCDYKKLIFPPNLRSFLLFCTFSLFVLQSLSQSALSVPALGTIDALDKVLSVRLFFFTIFFFLCQDFRADQNLQLVCCYNADWIREKAKSRYLYIEIFQESQIPALDFNWYCCLSCTENFVFRAS